INNDIYSTVDACPNACKMSKAIERLKLQIGSLENSHHGMVNQLNRITQVLTSITTRMSSSYHKLYDILKQHQNEVNELRAERLARAANPLALVAQQQPVYHPQNHPTHYTNNSSTRSQQAATRTRGKAIVNSSPPTYDQEPTMVAEDDEMSKEKEIDKLIALISLSFKKIYKPTNNNLRTSSNTSRANQEYTQRINRGTRECQKPKRAKDATYHKDKMLLYKQEEAGFQLNAEQDDWRDDTDDKPKDQDLEAHYLYMAQIQEVTPDAPDNFGPIFDAEPLQKIVEIILFIVDSGCSKHMTGNLKLLSNFVEKLLGTMKFRNDQIALILGYGDLGTYLYSITLQDTSTPNLICLMAKASSSQAWLWHRRLSHLNFDSINLLSKNDIVIGLPKLKFVKDHLCSSCELGKAKRKSFHTKTNPSSKRWLQLLHMDLCGPMPVQSINGKKYVLVIVDDYSRYTWTHFLRSKDETPEVLIDFLKLVQRGLHAQVRIVRTDKGIEFLNKTLHAYFSQEGIEHQTSIARTPEQNGVVERRNRTLVEAARTMLSTAKVPLYFWAEGIATTCFTQNHSLVIPQHEKTPYHIINGRKPSVKFFHIFGSLCYIVKDGENLYKIKEKGDACIFVGYSTQSRAYRITSVLTPFHNVQPQHLNMTV
ncbi:retrovirus-related pol polyprotein from transposon TNT 1-94, partial [Tanacetum coccineum]